MAKNVDGTIMTFMNVKEFKSPVYIILLHSLQEGLRRWPNNTRSYNLIGFQDTKICCEMKI